MSNAAVLARPSEQVSEAEWIEMDDDLGGDLLVFAPPIESDPEFIEMDPLVTVFESQDAMRFGPRTYTPEQAEVIHLVRHQRKPLPADPLPSDE